jgi:hypothetical protein
MDTNPGQKERKNLPRAAAGPQSPRKLSHRLRRPAAIILLLILAPGLWISPWLAVPRLTPVSLPARPGYHDYPGLLHLHSHYSHDSKGSLPQILQVARQHHFRFLVLTDHDTFQAAQDGWPGWQQGVLLLVGAEISLPRGHLLVLGVRSEAFAPLLAMRHGELRPFINAVHRAGGIALQLYYYLPHSKQRWRYGKVTGLDGVEVWNVFSDISNGPKLNLLRAGLVSRFSAPAALSGLLKRPYRSLRLWDSKNTGQQPFIATGGTDAHAKYFPYENELPTIVTHLVTRQAFTGEMEPDSQLIYASLRCQHYYFSNDSLYPATGFSFFASQQARTADLGESLELRPGAPARLVGAVPYRGAINWRLYRAGRLIWQGKGSRMDYAAATPGRYRVEVSYGSPARPWIFSSPIYLISPAAK